MKESIIYIVFVLTISSCCTDVYFKSEERFWFENYKKGDELIFESNNGDLDTIKITDVIIKMPSGDCNPLVSNYDKEFVQFLGIANGSTFELITQLILTKRLKLINEDLIQPIINQLVEVSNMNFALQKSLKNQ